MNFKINASKFIRSSNLNIQDSICHNNLRTLCCGKHCGKRCGWRSVIKLFAILFNIFCFLRHFPKKFTKIHLSSLLAFLICTKRWSEASEESLIVHWFRRQFSSCCHLIGINNGSRWHKINQIYRYIIIKWKQETWWIISKWLWLTVFRVKYLLNLKNARPVNTFI